MATAVERLSPRSGLQIREQVHEESSPRPEIISNLNNRQSTNGAEPRRATTTILLADDCAVTRRGIRTLIEGQQGWRVVAEASSGREAVIKAAEVRPDLIVLSVTMRELNGVDATRSILKAVPHARVLVLATFQTEELIQRALHAGIRGYMLKSDAEAELVSAMKALLQGGTFFTAASSEVILERGRGRRNERALSGLTVREAEIVQLLVEGNSNKQVAAILNISPRTVENHRAQIMDRLGMQSFSELIRYTVRIGIVEA